MSGISGLRVRGLRCVAASAVGVLVVAASAVLSAAPAQAATVDYLAADGITYALNSETHTASTKGTYPTYAGSPTVVIPATVTADDVTYTVTQIGPSTFSTANVTSVVIANTIVEIGSNAFYGTTLGAVTIPNSVVTLATGAFDRAGVTSVSFGDSIQTIGSQAFYGNSLTSIDLPDTLTSLAMHSFSGNNLTSVVIPAAVTTMDRAVFYANPSLASVIFRGAAPTTFTSTSEWMPSLGSNSNLTVYYAPEFGAPGGFTSPTWKGYASSTNPIVTFALNGYGQAVAAQMPVRGETVTAPTDPTDSIRAFGGWFSDATLQVPYNFADAVNGNLTLYAQWYLDAAFTAATPPAAVAGTPYSYSFLASGSAEPTFAVTSGQLPAGLDLSTDGVLSGTPTVAGSSTFAVTASNHMSVAAQVQLTVAAGALAEIVMTQPVSGEFLAVAGEAITFAASATDASGNAVTAPLTYSTSLVGSAFADVIDGATITFYTAGVRTVTVTGASVTTSFDVDVSAASPAVLSLSSSSMSAIVGDTVTLFLDGTDAYGNATKDLASQAVFTSDWASDMVDGATVRFTHASVHTITGMIGRLTSTVAIQLSDPVGVAAALAASERAALATAAQAAEAAALAKAGVNPMAGMLAGGVLLLAGLVLWVRRRVLA
ncbi:hypothetical protein E3O06_11540 [Cryobacterium glaciale]|uniref:Leucine-rich repeat domain-containing protein n=1 Tax=Cryobacterium glaciale TaxID=1259145 RepID=A0A4R8UWL1_9MICO|nr:leucine-rich repeat protein [Cryobacterium glaciale]TFB71887.1 hypothetical protein E3O06_11540 [Cryobacterium glaciale]